MGLGSTWFFKACRHEEQTALPIIGLTLTCGKPNLEDTSLVVHTPQTRLGSTTRLDAKFYNESPCCDFSGKLIKVTAARSVAHRTATACTCNQQTMNCCQAAVLTACISCNAGAKQHLINASCIWAKVIARTATVKECQEGCLSLQLI